MFVEKILPEEVGLNSIAASYLVLIKAAISLVKGYHTIPYTIHSTGTSK